MKLVDLEVTSFIEKVGSSSPAPGGGSVAALASSMGAALVEMVGKLSVNKKKFKALDEGIQHNFKLYMESINGLGKLMLNQVDEDTNAFNQIMAAFKLPKETVEEKADRKFAINEATVVATTVPLKGATLSIGALQTMGSILPYINKNTISDLGVAACMVQAGIEGMIMNVYINIPGLDEATASLLKEQARIILELSKDLKDSILEEVYSKL